MLKEEIKSYFQIGFQFAKKHKFSIVCGVLAASLAGNAYVACNYAGKTGTLAGGTAGLQDKENLGKKLGQGHISVRFATPEEIKRWAKEDALERMRNGGKMRELKLLPEDPFSDSQVEIRYKATVKNTSFNLEERFAIIPSGVPRGKGSGYVWSWKGEHCVNIDGLERTITDVLHQMPNINPENIKAFNRLLMETAAAESNRGYFMIQKNGPARGMYQMEIETINELIEYLKENHEDLYKTIETFYVKEQDFDWNIKYNVPWQTAMAITNYWRKAGGNDRLMKFVNTSDDRFIVYKKIWNTTLGKTTYKKYNERVDKYA